MITRRGWALVVGALALGAAGRVLGVLELFVLAAGAVALVVIAVVLVRARRPGVEALRRLHPPRVHAGNESRVELVVRNRHQRRSPVLTVTDPFDGGRRQARLLLAPIGGGGQERANYRLPTERRGVFSLGPLQAERIDPFGLASARWDIAPSAELVVYPRVDPIVPLPRTFGQDPDAGADFATAVGSSGDDFYGLRAYEMGDDLRRVHWPSTARTGDLMIRQNEMPWQGRVTVLADIRAGLHDESSLDATASAAASIVMACWRHGWLVRLVTSGGWESTFASGHDQLENILYHLAVMQPSGDGDLDNVVRGLHGGRHGGALTAITSSGITSSGITSSGPTPSGPTPSGGGADLEKVARLRGRFGSLTAVVFGRGASDAGGGVVEGRRLRAVTLVPVGAGVSFQEAWNRVMSTRGAARDAASMGRRSRRPRPPRPLRPGASR